MSRAGSVLTGGLYFLTSALIRVPFDMITTTAA